MTKPTVTDEMVNRFLSWRLPSSFNPDCGISFKRTYNESSPYGPAEHEPTGTNLLDAVQARAMLEHVLAGCTQAPAATEAPSYWTAHDMAKAFHDAYEELAPEFGYETRSDTKVWDRHSNNGRLMIAVCKRIAGPTAALADEPTEAMCVAMARRVLLNKPDGASWEEVMRLAYLDARALATPAPTVGASEPELRAAFEAWAAEEWGGKTPPHNAWLGFKGHASLSRAVGASVQPAAGALPPVRWWSGVVGSPEKLANLLDEYSEKKESPRRDERVMRAAAKWIREVGASVQPVLANPMHSRVLLCPNCLGTRAPSATDPDWKGRCECALASSTPTKGGQTS